MSQVLGTFVRNRQWSQVQWTVIEECNVSAAELQAFSYGKLNENTLAFLQYTSGSTAQPKGVMVSHISLLHNCYAAIRNFSFPARLDSFGAKGNSDAVTSNLSLEQYSFYDCEKFWKERHRISVAALGHRLRVFSWLPVYHDMGLIGFVCTPILFGATLYQMSPLDFIRRPHIWLKAMSEFYCVGCAAPNFAYEVVCRKMPDHVFSKLDLRHVCGFLCGAEPIRASTVRKFLEVGIVSL